MGEKKKQPQNENWWLHRMKPMRLHLFNLIPLINETSQQDAWIIHFSNTFFFWNWDDNKIQTQRFHICCPNVYNFRIFIEFRPIVFFSLFLYVFTLIISHISQPNEGCILSHPSNQFCQIEYNIYNTLAFYIVLNFQYQISVIDVFYYIYLFTKVNFHLMCVRKFISW